jgi:hypothetical protein
VAIGREDPDFQQVDFRAGNANIKPYVEVPFDADFGVLPTTKIIYGPTLRNEDDPQEIVKWMLAKYSNLPVAS